MGRKTFFRTTALIAVLGSTLLGGNAMGVLPQGTTAVEVSVQTIQLIQERDKIFPKSDKVDRRKVTSKNRYGLTLAGDLYIPKSVKGKLPVIAVSNPFDVVKKQTSGLYAQMLAERDFVTIAFDDSYTGENLGTPCNVPLPEINTKDFSAAIDLLGSLDNVSRDEVGILGVCGRGEFTLSTAVSDPRIKAVTASTTYDATRTTTNGYEVKMQANVNGLYDRALVQGADACHKMKLNTSNTHWETSKNGYTDLLSPINLDPEKDFTAGTPKFVREYVNFYRTKRGCHPRSVNSSPDASWIVMGTLLPVNVPILKYAAESKASALVVHGRTVHSHYLGENAYKVLSSRDKELYIIPDAAHTDLYDNSINKTPFDEFEQFFKAKLG